MLPSTSRWIVVTPRGVPFLVVALLAVPLLVVGVGCKPKVVGRAMAGDFIALKVKDRTIQAEVACDDLSRLTGCMGRDRLGENQGMIFVYPRPDFLSFWMRNTSIPLSIAFLDDGGKILQIEDMQPHDETRTVSTTRVRYALEVNQGWFQRNNVGVGDAFLDFATTVAPYHRG